jgi:hypothetical protein
MRLLTRLLAFFLPSLFPVAEGLREGIPWQRARATIEHRRPTRWRDDGSPDPTSYELVGEPETVWNVITNAGRDFLHVQGYGSSGLGANGLNYIALSNDAVTEDATSTVLSNEIAANGLSRAQGTVTHNPNTNTTTVGKTFTCATAPQSARKAALFTAASNGVMNHVLGFTQRSLQVGDTLTVVFTLTLG